MVLGGWLPLELAADTDVVHVILALQACRMQELWGHGNFHSDFKEGLTNQAMCDKVRIPTGSPERVTCEAVKVKSKLQWLPQKLEMPGMWMSIEESHMQ
jgi:hypothetical protein